MSGAAKFMIFSSFAFSLMHLCVKALPHIPVFELVFFRSICSLFISYIYLKKEKKAVFGKNKKLLLARGIFGTIGLTLFFITLQKLPLAGAVTIQYLSPIFTAIFAVFFLKEKVKPRQWFFFGLAFSGVFLLKGFDISGQISQLFFFIGILSALFSGLAYSTIRFLRRTEDQLVVVFYFPLVATPVMGLMSFFNWVQPQGLDWLYLVLMGVIAQLAQVYMTKGIQSDLAGNTMTYKYVGVLFAFIYGFFFFEETYSFLSVFGILLLILGVILNSLFKNKDGD